MSVAALPIRRPTAIERRPERQALRPAIVVTACILSACSTNESKPGPEASGERQQVLAALADDVLRPAFADFASAADDVRSATETHAGSLSATDRDAARASWTSAMLVWQRAELMQVGPGAPATMDFPGGADLRDAIYSFPIVNTCVVDQELVSGEYADRAGFASGAAPNRLGLDALEYLLFNEAPDNSCAPQVAINTSGQWASLGDTEIQKRRADYAAALGGILADDARRLVDAWDPAVGDFRRELVDAGFGASTFRDQKQAFDAVYSALLYLDTETKDTKLALPAGLSIECASATCPEALESKFAKVSKQQIRSNLEGLGTVIFGPEPESDRTLAALLGAAGAPDLRGRMQAELTAALAAVDAIEETSLADALDADLASVLALHDAVKKLTDSLKSQFATTLDMAALGGGIGDND